MSDSSRPIDRFTYSWPTSAEPGEIGAMQAYLSSLWALESGALVRFACRERKMMFTAQLDDQRWTVRVSDPSEVRAASLAEAPWAFPLIAI